jgi:glycosyltransferase involved in cell wall biosynthesis
MRILWVAAGFLHPTTRGGQIRTLETLRRLHVRHEIHYAALADAAQPEGPARAAEYSTRCYAVPHRAPRRGSPAFAAQMAANLVERLPLAVSRYRSKALRETIRSLLSERRFDSVVCDFLFPAPNLERVEDCVLFEHNVETTIWRRHTETSGDPLRRAYFGMQARRMFAYEREVCRKARHVIAVSEVDAGAIRRMFGAERVSAISTGVDVERFRPPAERPPDADLVFAGSLDWMPNIDGVEYFIGEILPLIWARRPQCRVTLAGRTPPASIVRLGERDARIRVTGTVPDIRPYLWGAKVAVIPLRIGSGTRLKIYEAMAAKVPVVSTTIGAEGLVYDAGGHLHIADSPAEFAARCLELLENPAERERMAEEAWRLVATRFSWEQVASEFEAILERNRLPG